MTASQLVKILRVFCTTRRTLKWLQEPATSAVSEKDETSIHPTPFLFKIRFNTREDWKLLQYRCDNSNLGEIEFLQDGSYHNCLPCSEYSEHNQQDYTLKIFSIFSFLVAIKCFKIVTGNYILAMVLFIYICQYFCNLIFCLWVYSPWICYRHEYFPGFLYFTIYKNTQHNGATNFWDSNYKTHTDFICFKTLKKRVLELIKFSELVAV